MTDRSAVIERTTSETKVRVGLSLDGGRVQVDTGVPFLDHMLDQVGRHGHLGLEVEAHGDLEVDAHHTVEDVGLAFGSALSTAVGDKGGTRRYGDSLVPMEESLTQVALDLSGRGLLVYEAELASERIGVFEVYLVREFFHAVARSGGITIHVRLLRSDNAHHAVESVFKAFARALGDAVALDPRADGQIPSTKGTL
ncbi:MAG: imidazoleglycerol-phosphate dehydratase HisB [Actinobacteria bacterium]|nr:imidazoleglycerol-phosphate dehydratase HisB [Actinomycetota bacterium]